MTKICIFLAIAIVSIQIANATPDWSEGSKIPVGGRANPYGLSESEYSAAVLNGKLHAQHYPVSVTGLLPPYFPLERFIQEENQNPLRQLLQSLFRGITDASSFQDITAWIGMHPYPAENEVGVYQVPYPDQKRPEYLMGFTPRWRNGALGFTYSCAACHSANLFGKTVLGMTNRFPRANQAFARVQMLSPMMNADMFSIYNRATPEEAELLRQTLDNFKSVSTQKPLALGLDTSLAQVSLSLAKRADDAFASKSRWFETFPRPDYFDHARADSKPAVWWNLKYKNRWLSDGSVVSGNPIFTNILWNEIGRGSDLKEVDQWLTENEKAIQELTSAVFSIEPPPITDFFPAHKIDIVQARHGEKIFNQMCSRCHGVYEKAWSLPTSQQLSDIERLKTTLVRYKEVTPVIDVGTDPLRYLGMQALTKLNELEISKRNKALVKPQKGYVPPPLVGIWARWPYLHNNSIPNLCALLQAPEDRPDIYYAHEANDPHTDFDFECNGYPTGDKMPKDWKQTGNRFNTLTDGLSNRGHYENILRKNGQELLTATQKSHLIQFLQTL